VQPALPIDAHLMIVEPGQYAEQFVKAGAQMVSIHIEADPHAHRTLSGNSRGRGTGRNRNQPGHVLCRRLKNL
jgi:pentose-5-phosphate-3-epimerase